MLLARTDPIQRRTGTIWIQVIGAMLVACEIFVMLFVDFPVCCLAAFAAVVPADQESASSDHIFL
jgi:hypothetical protein